MKLAIILFFALGGLNSQAADFDTLLGASAKQAIAGSAELPDFPMPETPTVPQMPLPFMPPSDPQPFFTATCMLYCPWGYDNRPGANPCACHDPFEGDMACRLSCEAGGPVDPMCDCGPLYWANSTRGKRSPKASGGDSKSLTSFLESTATVTCGGVEYSIFAFPMNCGMESVLPPDWLETAASYSAWQDTRARQPQLKDMAFQYFADSGNEAAANAVARRSSRIFSDGATLFVADDGKVAGIADKIAARRVYETTFPLTVSEKARRDLGVHKDVVRGVLACMASDACWNGAAGNHN